MIHDIKYNDIFQQTDNMGSIFASVVSGKHCGNQAVYNSPSRKITPKMKTSTLNKPRLSRSMSVTTAITSSFATLSEISPLRGSTPIYHTASSTIPETPKSSKTRRHSASTLNVITGRPAYVRYRSRRSAQQRTRPGNCPYTPPCDLIEHALATQTEEANDLSENVMNRIVPLVLTWYMSWILDLYNLLRNQSNGHSFWRWAMSCIIVTLLTLVLFTGLASVLLQAMYYISLIADGLVAFTLFLIFMVTGSVCVILIANYGVFK